LNNENIFIILRIMTIQTAESLLINAASSTLQSGLNGAIDGINASMSSIFALFGEQFQNDMLSQIDQLKIGIDFEIDSIKFKAIQFDTNINIHLKNIEFEFNELNTNIGVPSIKSIEAPQLSFLKWIDSIGIYILIIAGIISIFILYDAYKINNMSYLRGRDQRISMVNHL